MPAALWAGFQWRRPKLRKSIRPPREFGNRISLSERGRRSSASNAFACSGTARLLSRVFVCTGLHFIPPGQPWRNGYVESFNSRVRDECLNINMFWSLAQARVVISDWKADYNHRRRHSALGYQAPAVYAAARTHP
jgi:transposase InsO family protein